jgi:cystathionine beta-lyase/cystathionine gamma-synthase
MPGPADPGFDTLALHAGAAPDPNTGARAVPLHLSTSFVFQSSEHAAALFNLERSGHVYSRLSATPPPRCWNNAWRRWTPAWAHWPPPADRPRCTWPSPR